MPGEVRVANRFSYVEAGSGLPIVFVPGIVGAKEHFIYQLSGLSDRYRVLSYDLRKAERRYSLDLLCSDLAQFLDTVHIHQAVIAGHSFGSLIAQKFAASHPQRCTGLVLICGAPSFGAMTREQLLHALPPGELRFPGLIQRLWQKITGEKPVSVDESDALAGLCTFNRLLDAPTMSARLGLALETDLTGILEQIQAPVLAIAASDDLPEVLAGSSIIYNTIANSVLEVVESAGHHCFYTRHDVINTLIDEFVNLRILRR